MPELLDSLPELYRNLVPAALRAPVPVESKATCANCAMCQPDAAVESVDGQSRLFRPDTKCCTFHPRLPNYLIGALLADTRPELEPGRARIRAKIAARTGVGPQWLAPPAKYTLFYNQSRRTFGRTGALVCPYFDRDGGGCTIWPYREAVCSTFFCKYVAGADGRKMWMTLKSYLSLLEVQLSRWALLELAPDIVHALRERNVDPTHPVLTPEDLDDQPMPAAAYRALWGTWEGREEELYRACHARVAGLDAAAVEKLLGLDGVIEQQAIERAHAAATASTLPERLRFNAAATVKWLADGSVALGSYSEYDAIALPGAAYALLVAFDGRPVAEVRARLREERGADLDEGVLQVLHQHRILVAP